MDSPTITYLVGFIVILIGEMWAVYDSRPMNTISERVWWLVGRGRSITWFFLISRILVFGFLVWLLLHFATGAV